MRVPINKPILGEEEKKLVLRVLESGTLTNASLSGGPMVRRFEEEFAEFIGVRHAIAVNSGTAALYASLLALNIGPGDEVLVPSFTFLATANVILLVGAKPVFVDISLEDYNIDVQDLERKITQKSKAVIPVHLYGFPAKMEEIMEIAEKYGLYVIEDACQAHGSLYKGKKAGSIGHLAAFSFYPSKVITTGEGGMITTNDDELAEKLRSIRTHGQLKGYDSVRLGFNLRMPEMEAAVGIAQLGKIKYFLEKRRENAYRLMEFLDNPNIVKPFEDDERKHNWYLFTVRFDCQETRDRALKKLREEGIGATIYYDPPVHLTPLYSQLGYSKVPLPRTEQASKTVLSLPVHPLVEEEDLKLIAEILNRL
ncbi:MAG: hypothetical protein DRJ47_09350 [Thermoprotei archaeon]|nr:MAG: hypothetical protein DRJ47_09350 [Thermoprotei archaeon]